MTKDTDPAERIRDLEQRLASVDAMLPDFRRGLAALFAEPPYPRAAVLAVMRALADRAGHSVHCASTRCRRAKTCRGGGLSGPEVPPCAARWSAAHTARVDAALMGVVAAWRDEAHRAERLRALVPQPEEENGGGKIKRGRG